MKTAVIISGGNIDDDFALAFLKKEPYEWLIGADRGLEYLKKVGIRPTHIVGDFDSANLEAKHYFEQFEGIEIRTFNPVKDFTDTDAAIQRALELGAEHITVLGGTGTRLDHVLANVRSLYAALKQGVEAILLDAHNRIRLVEAPVTIRKDEQFGTYISLFALTEVKNLTLRGFCYPLTDYRLRTSDPLCVSNALLEEEGRILFSDGTLILIESKD